MKRILDNITNIMLNDKVLTIIGAFVIPLFATKLLLKNNEIDPIIGFLILSVCFIIAIKILTLSFKYTLLPYFILQFIIIWIFIDKKFFAYLGLDIKLYALAFGIAFLLSLYYILKNFDYLWKNFLSFRLLLVFFLINILYFAFYHSDIRIWYAAYLDTWLASPQIKLLFLKKGIKVFTKEFSETQYIGMYLGSLVPIVCLTCSLMVFKGLKSLDTINKRIILIIKCFCYIFLTYFTLSILTVLLGLSDVGFFTGRLWGDFLGFGQSFSIYLSYYLIILLGFKLFLSSIQENEVPEKLNVILNILILTCFLLILLQINKTSIIALFLAITVLIILCFKSALIKGFINNIIFIRPVKYTAVKKLAIICALLLFIFVGIIYLDQMLDIINITLTRLEYRFVTFSTFETRIVLWEFFVKNWVEHLTIFKILFGFGVDASRESAFLTSLMLPDEIKLFSSPQPHIHNLYLEMFYDYGLIALLFFGAIFSIFVDNIKTINSKASNESSKLFSIISITILVYFFVFEINYILRIPISIVFFSLLGLLESVKYALKNSNNAFNE